MLDLSLAIVHHLAIFALFGVLIVEMALVERGMTRNTVITVVKVSLVRNPRRADPHRRVLSSRLCSERMGVLLSQWVLLGEDRGVRRGWTFSPCLRL